MSDNDIQRMGRANLPNRPGAINVDKLWFLWALRHISPHDHLLFRFFPVGQGLFSAGVVGSGGRNPFVWVYDCGTSSSRTLLDSAIADFRGWHAGHIGLLALSHFDKDHVSGVCDLIRGRRVGVLMLPYVTFSERVRLALDAGVQPDDPFLAFFLDPAAYFLERFPNAIGRILYAPAGGENTAFRGEEQNAWEGAALDDYLTYEPGEPNPGEDPAAPPTMDDPRVVWLRPGGSLRFRDIWEFVPYNDAIRQRRPLDPQAATDFMKYRDEDSLERLRADYDAAFGKGSRPRNAISLFLYAGPLAVFDDWPKRWCALVGGRDDEFIPFENSVPGWLATGDGYLDDPKRVDRLLRYLGPPRIQRIKVLQVMHHGAERNWCPDVAANIKPSVSVFSSDPGDGRYEHPDDAVCDDFARYGRVVQVDRTRGCWIAGPFPS